MYYPAGEIKIGLWIEGLLNRWFDKSEYEALI